MSLNDILSSASSGLAAAQAGLKSVSNNIANVGVAGYARERVSLSTGVTSGRVNGVVVGEPTRVADRFLEATVYRRSGDYGRSEVTSNYLDRLQSLLGQPGSKSGLPARLDAIGASAVALTGSQNSTQTVAAFTANVQDAIDSMQQLDKDVSGLRGDIESEVGYTVDRVNVLLQRIHELNGSVSAMTGLGRSVSGAADQRMKAIEELSTLINVTVRDQPDGRVTIDTASGTALLDRKLRQLSYPSNGSNMSQAIYPPIDIRFAEDDGTTGASTGEKIDSAAAGGKLGGLLDLRDRALPELSEKLGVLYGGLAEVLNSVSNASSTVPPPKTLEGRPTGLVGTDKHNFTGKATFAVTGADGTLVSKYVVDFDAMPAGSTVDDVVAAINTGLAGTGTVSYTDGKMSFTATGAGNGVVIGQDATKPSSRGGVGFSQYFGMNDMIRSETSPLVPSGFSNTDAHGFGAGQSADIVLRDPTGRALTRFTLNPTPGGAVGDMVAQLNGSPLSSYGSFALDDRGRIQFTPDATVSGATLSIPADSTDRLGTGLSFSELMGINGASAGLGDSQVLPNIQASPGKLPLAQLQDVAVGQKALGAGDIRGATMLVEKLSKNVDLGKDGNVTLETFSASLLGKVGLEASQADDRYADATARRNDAVGRRDSFSGVNIDEELSQMVVLQSSYSAAARVLSTAQTMYDELLGMIR